MNRKVRSVREVSVHRLAAEFAPAGSSSSSVTQFKESNTLLTYALVTAPAPVQISPSSGPASVAAISLVVSCPLTLEQVKVTQITFSLPITDPKAPDSNDLALTDEGIGHSVASSGSDGWTNELGAAAGTFVVKPKSGQSGVITRQGLTISFPGIKVSPIVGTAWLTIVETATADASPAQPRQASIAVPKFPLGFFAGNFAPAKPLVQNGESAVLSWSGSTNAVYTIFWGSNSEVVTNVRSWRSPALTEVTTFMLSVAAQQSGQTVVLYFTVTVEVANPDLTAKSVTVSGPATIEGVSSLKGPLVARGPIELWGTPKTVAPGSYQAATDGLVIGTVRSQPGSSKIECDTEIWGKAGDITLYATGGGILEAIKSGNPRSTYGARMMNSFVLPVRKGQTWSIGHGRNALGLPDPLFTFYWFPLGVAPQVQSQSKEGIERPTHAKKNGPKSGGPELLSQNRWLSGHGKLAKGRATVRFGTAGAPSMSKGKLAYVVQLTPHGECHGLAVAAKHSERFDVAELGRGRSNIAFDWTISFPPNDVR